MLVEFTIQNFSSFNEPQTLSMLASSSTKENFNTENVINVDRFSINDLLKSAVIFGANAGGKSNFIKSLYTFKNIILNSQVTAEENHLDTVVPFLIKDEPFDHPSEFEVVFLYEGNLYRYGISIIKGVIDQEWLFWTKTARETLLFERVGQEIKINKRSFSEASDFIEKKKGGKGHVLKKTRNNVPFISVLFQFDGEKSTKVVKWFQNIAIISGLQEEGFRDFTLKLFDEDTVFKTWALDILSSLQIQGISITDVDIPPTSVHIRKKTVNVIKKAEDGQEYTLPLSYESEGTKKLIYLLGPIFNVISNGKLLLVDEFDTKFHSLLSKFILMLYHQKSNNNSQLVVTCHDTNLLTKELLRRDQIWFVEKNVKHESELYSLLEYKEHYTRKHDSYSKDYLAGKYGAVPLFNSIDQLKEALDG